MQLWHEGIDDASEAKLWEEAGTETVKKNPLGRSQCPSSLSPTFFSYQGQTYIQEISLADVIKQSHNITISQQCDVIKQSPAEYSSVPYYNSTNEGK